MKNNENFQPLSHFSENAFINSLLFISRLIIDFQFKTIYFSFNKKKLSEIKGKVIDVGCGDSPYKKLFDNIEYIGLDYNDASRFNYKRNDIKYYDGKIFPFNDDDADFILCTEVLEHIEEPSKFMEEVYRVLKPGSRTLFTVPWSARYHYIPFDFYRYTPATLMKLFNKFKTVDIQPRGTELTVICSKFIVFYFGLALNIFKADTLFLLGINCLIKLLFILVLFPVLSICILTGHLSLLFRIGSVNDCLGYTIEAVK